MKSVRFVFLVTLLPVATAEDVCDSGRSAASPVRSSLLQVRHRRQRQPSQPTPASGNWSLIKDKDATGVQTWGVPAELADSASNRRFGQHQRHPRTNGKRSRNAQVDRWTRSGVTELQKAEPISGMPWTVGVEEVHALAGSLSPESDKFFSHSYQTMYGMFLGPLSKGSYKPKMLEIGLGCTMTYGPGASLKFWKQLLPNAELWESDIDVQCVDESRSRGQLENVNVLTGDQGNKTVLAQWLQISGGNFDVIVDDGGHKNGQIKASFDVLWPAVKPGGLYFIEDMHVGRHEDYDDTGGNMVMSDVIQAWIEQLIIAQSRDKAIAKDANTTSLRWPLPDAVDFVMCQAEACVIGKSPK